MHMSLREWEMARNDFFDAFKNYDEAGISRRIHCLKYLILSNMLMNSDISPFDSQANGAAIGMEGGAAPSGRERRRTGSSTSPRGATHAIDHCLSLSSFWPRNWIDPPPPCSHPAGGEAVQE